MIKQYNVKNLRTPVTSNDEIVEKWYIIDATGQSIGRLATVTAELLLGKNDAKMAMSRNLLPKNKVVVINSAKLKIAAKKSADKIYTNYSGYPGGLRERTLDKVMQTRPTEVIEHAVKGMLPKNRRGKAIAANLHIYEGAEYTQTAQQPVAVKL
jgi:large subunit ribosomal protein L13